MPAVAVVVDVIATDVIGSSIATAVADVVGSTLVGDVVSGAVISGLGGAASAAVQGQNVWKGFEKSAEIGGITAGIAPAITSEAQTLGASKDVASAIGKGLGTTAALAATGTPLKQSLEYGGISGLVNYAVPGSGTEAQLERGALQSGLNALITPKSQGGIPSLGAAPITGQYSKTQTTPGTAALGQALGVGDAGAPVLGGGTDSTSKKNVWNVESLRYMGGGGTPSEQTNG